MLATGWKIVNDTTWEFTLRQGVKFHNGEPFNAQSVKATLEYALDPASKSHFAASAYWKPVKDVQIVNDYTVRLITEKPWPSLIDHASLTNSLMMPARALKEQGAQALAQKPIGTGPFRFVEWKRDDRLVLERNPDYWLDELIKQVLKGQATRMCGPLAPPNADFAQVECYKHDPARAQALFKEAGIDPAKLTLTLDTPSGRYPLDNDVSLAIAAQLQRIGIR
jgi:ABC-type transport system substrate-binding protein